MSHLASPNDQCSMLLNAIEMSLLNILTHCIASITIISIIIIIIIIIDVK